MSELAGDNSIPRHLLTVGGITIVMSQLASLHPWIAGLSTFIVLMLVMASIALKGDARTTRMLVIVSAFLATGASWFPGSDLSVSMAVFVSVLGTSSLAALSWLVCRTSQQRQSQITGLEQQNSLLARQLYDQEKQRAAGSDLALVVPTTMSESTAVVGFPASAESTELATTHESASLTTVDREFFDFAMLLLSMQRIGHRLSAELDLSSLVTAILETCNELLHARRSELFLWDAHEERLRNATCVGEGVAETLQSVLSDSSSANPAFDWVLKNRRTLTRRDAINHRIVLPNLAAESLPSAVAPLLVGEEIVGVLVIEGIEDDGPTFARMLYILANHCALSLKNAQLFRHIEQMARHDSLTGLLNHASFLEALEPLVQEALSNNKPLTVVMSDIDHFKSVNDTYGHQAGDKVLQEVSRWWRAIMPNHALLARYGGEEFICALPGENLARGEELAEMLRASLEATPISHNGTQLNVTASFGVAELGRPATKLARLIRLADKALYKAKDDGRNRIESHNPDRRDSVDLNDLASLLATQEA